jgi:hypothetical protein
VNDGYVYLWVGSCLCRYSVSTWEVEYISNTDPGQLIFNDGVIVLLGKSYPRYIALT